MNRKTATILCAAGGLVAAAILLGRRPGQTHVAEAKANPPMTTPNVCAATDVTARTSTDVGFGSFGGALSGAKILRGGDGEIFVAYDLTAADRRAETRQPVNLAIVLDHSGSMAGDKLVQAKAAAKGIIERLGPEDRVALVKFDDTAHVVVPAMTMDAEGKAQLLAAIDGIQDAGGTNIHDGMTLGRDQVAAMMGEGRVNRVVLLSDGLAKNGITDPAVMTRVAAQAADKGIRITTIGLGQDYNEDLMEALAEHGRGQYYYVRDGASLQAVFDGELRSMQATVATNAELRLEPSCAGVEIAEVYGYESRRDGRAVIVPLADVSGGDTRKIIVRLKVPVAQAGSEQLIGATLAFTDAVKGGKKTVAIRLGVEVTADAGAVAAAADKDVLGKVEQVEAARTMRQASAAYERGDRAAAVQAVREQRARTEERAGRYNLAPAATAPVYESMAEMEDGYTRHDPGSGDGKALTKKGKADARDMAKH